MKVLIATKFWFRRGGLENVAFDEADWLQQNGHDVAHFSTLREQNQESRWSRYFVRYYELGVEGQASGADRLRAAARMFYNREAARNFADLLDDFAPDIIHCHGIHRQLSPSILFVARKRGVPVVQTLHDYHPICPQDLLTRAGTAVCEPRLCRGLNYWPCIRYKCMQESRSVSIVSASELFWRRWVLRYDRLVDRFISPSSFLAEMIRKAGYTTPVAVVANAVAPEMVAAVSQADAVGDAVLDPLRDKLPTSPFFLYAGRVARDKGADTIVEAVRRAGVQLVVAGDGPLLDSLAATQPPGVTFLGRLKREQVVALVRTSVGSVVPSQWYENASISVLEAMAAGRPVVASRIAGITEQIRDGVDGFLIEPNDVDGFARSMLALVQGRSLARSMGASARVRALETYSPDRHGRDLVNVYRQLVARAAAVRAGEHDPDSMKTPYAKPTVGTDGGTTAEERG